MEVLGLLLPHLSEEAPQLGELVARLPLAGRDLLEAAPHELDALVEQRREDLVLALEIPEQRRLRELTGLGDLLGRRRGEAALADQLARRVQHQLAPRLTLPLSSLLDTHGYISSARAMVSRWISLVPSPSSSTLQSR